MAYLSYRLYTRLNRQNALTPDDLGRDLVASGTINTTATLSAALSIPAKTQQQDIVAFFRAVGAPVYVHICKAGVTPAGTGAHAAADAQPREFIHPDDGIVPVLLPDGGSFAAVDAAAFA